MNPGLKVVRGKEVLRKLRKAGFVVVRVKGSVHILRNFETGKETYVHVHGGEDIPRGTLRAIIRQAGLTVEEFNEL